MNTSTEKYYRVVITGGGTGGHIFPALAIAGELQRRGIHVDYVGGENGMETKLVPARGLPFYTVKSGAVKNQSVKKLFNTAGKLIVGVWESIRLLRKLKPNAVIGVGGYISVPVVFAAFLLRIPIYLQEQNASVGIANRFLGKLAHTVFLGFEQGKSSFAERKVTVTGNPLREEFFSGELPAYNPSGRFLFVMGGSQGAQTINQCIVDLLESIDKQFPGTTILHQTGAKDLEKVREAYAAKFKGKYEVVPFVEDMVGAYGRASMVVARSGALTCSELIQVQRPAILVPFPRKGQNDQTANAYLLQHHNAAVVVEQGSDFKERFWEVFGETFQPKNLSKMAEGAAKLQRSPGLATIGDRIARDLGL